jgi:hypothetical protein
MNFKKHDDGDDGLNKSPTRKEDNGLNHGLDEPNEDLAELEIEHED